MRTLAVARLADLGAREILAGLGEAVREWTGERCPTDDLTLLVLKVNDTA